MFTLSRTRRIGRSPTLSSNARGWVPRSSFGLWLLFCGAVAVLAAATPARAQQILETYGRTLTFYCADAPTPLGNVYLSDLHRGVNFDGTLRAPSLQGWACAGNPFGEGWDSNNRLQDVRLDDGGYHPTEVDIALPCTGPRWIIGRAYNGMQDSGAHHDALTSQQGSNWMQTSQVELAFASGSSDTDDVVYIVYGADRYLEFQRTGTGSDLFKGKNGAAGVLKHTAGSAGPPSVPEKYEYYDQNGTVTTFFGSDYCGDAAWQIWKIEDPAGNKAYVGDPSSMATAKSSYGNGTTGPVGGIITAYDSANRRYTYTYGTSISSVKRLTQVLAETQSGGSWHSAGSDVEVGRVEYAYYSSTTNDVGLSPNLKLVTLTTPLTDGSLTRKKYYRYYTRTWDDSDGRRGSAQQLKMVLGFEGCRNYDWQDTTFDDDFLSDSESSLKPYAEAYFEYYPSNDANNPYKVKTAFFNGQCGCSGGVSGTYTFSYDNSSSAAANRADTSYQNGWATRAVVHQPDGSYLTQYFDETGQPLSRVLSNTDPAGSPTQKWATEVLRASSTSSGAVIGCISEIRTPAANSSYTHDTTGSPTGTFSASSSVGLIHTYVRQDSGNLTGFLLERHWKSPGTSGTTYYDGSTTYTSRDFTGTSPNVVRPLIASSTQYTVQNSNSAGDIRTTGQSYTFHHSTSTNILYLAIASNTTTYPTVTSSTPANNGSGSATTMVQYFYPDGKPSFSTAPDGIISYRGYDAATGQMIVSIQDADVTLTGGGQDFSGVTIPGGLSNSGTPLHIKTSYAYDPQGRPTATTLPNARVTRTEYGKLDDGRTVTLSSPKYVASGTHSYGPVSYTVANLAGKAAATGQIGFNDPGYSTFYNSTNQTLTSWINTGGNELTCISTSRTITMVTYTGAVLHLTTNIYDEPGTELDESRVYFNLASFPGSSSNYDSTQFVYDDMGRRLRTQSPAGDITRVVFDAAGRAVEQWTGTNDGDWPTNSSGNMVKVSSTEFDGGSAGENSYVTGRSQYPAGATGVRTTTYVNDDRGRAIVVTNPQSPHMVTAFDNLGRATAVGGYSTTSGLTATAVPTTTSNRMTYAETSYDQKGQVFQTVRHKIAQSGSHGTSTDSITTDYWYDSAGRKIKTQGEQLTKTIYDRLGRAQRNFVLAKVRASGGGDETAYTDADDVSDDIVLEENQTVFDKYTGNVLLQTSIMRHPTESTSTYGPLDGNGAGRTTITGSSIEGRIQISASWYDALDRLSYSVAYGTFGIVGDGSGAVSFDRDSVSQSRTSSQLRTDYSYPDFRQQHLSSGFYGTYQDVTDPRGLITRTWFDDAGRKVFTIANYLNGVPSGVTGADDVYTRYVYTSGLVTQMWVDLNGDNAVDSDDQVTKYLYGVSASASNTPSLIDCKRLLRAVIYPDSSNGGATASSIDAGGMGADADLVSFEYNALGQEIYRKDQAGNVFEKTYDTGGRLTSHKFTTIQTGSGYDDAVKRIDASYVNRGMVEYVTQYNATSSGTALDQVKYEYDDWGQLAVFRQAADGTIAGGTPRALFYTVEKATPTGGRRTLRRSEMFYPTAVGEYNDIVFTYNSSGAAIDDASNRVSSIYRPSTADEVTYTYAGAGMVVGSYLETSAVYSRLYDPATLGSYYLDDFNRVSSSRWTKDLSSDVDFYRVDLGYDANSNITSATDMILKDGSGNRRYDVAYSIDDLNRVTAADEGTVSGGSVSGNRRIKETWTLEQTGNFYENWIDLNANNSVDTPGDINDQRAHNKDNSIDSWRPDGSTTYSSLGYDATGNLTDDKRDYKFIYDVLGRLRKVKNQSNALVAEYRYNGLGYRIGWHYNVDGDGSVENNSDDPWFFFCYDERWRIICTFREGDGYPKEQFVYNAAGAGGFGPSSYIDSVAWRDRDMSNGWAGAADGTPEECRYYCQNWRNDVSAVITGDGKLVERIKYSAYGTPFSLPAGDTDSDGDFNSTSTGDDGDKIKTWPGGYDVRHDADLDGDVDGSDFTWADGLTHVLGRGVLSGCGNRKGYAGYENDDVLGDSFISNTCSRIWHVRHRVLDSCLGMWTTRDPAEYADSPSLLQYVGDHPLASTDPLGLCMRTEVRYSLGGDVLSFRGPPPWNLRVSGRGGASGILEECECGINGKRGTVDLQGFIEGQVEAFPGLRLDVHAGKLSIEGWLGGHIQGSVRGEFGLGAVLYDTCQGISSADPRVCLGLQGSITGEIGGELAIQYRWWEWRVGVVAGASCSLMLRVCVRWNHGDLVADEFKLIGWQCGVHARVCFGPLGSCINWNRTIEGGGIATDYSAIPERDSPNRFR